MTLLISSLMPIPDPTSLFGQDRGNSVQINSTLFLITDQAATASKARRFELPENPSGRAISEELMILEL